MKINQLTSLMFALSAGITMVTINVWIGLLLFVAAMYDSKGVLFE